MVNSVDHKFVVRPLVALLACLAVSCSRSSPTAPSATTTPQTTATAAAAPAGSSTQATVASVLPASLAATTAPQTVMVSGSNFQPGLTVDFVPNSAPSGQRAQEVKSVVVENVTDSSFEVVVTVTDAGTYTLRVTNPSSEPSAPVTVTAELNDTPGPTVVGISPKAPTVNPNPQPIYVGGSNFETGLSVKLTTPDGSSSTIPPGSITIGSSTLFQMMASLTVTGSYSLQVVDPSGQTSAPWPFTVGTADPPPTPPAPPAPPTPPSTPPPTTPTTSAPSIAGLSPKSPTKSSNPQTIYVGGANFAAGLTATVTNPAGVAATLGSDAVQNVTATSFQMTVFLPDVGAYSLRVTNQNGQSSDVFPFTVKDLETAVAPVITAFSPASPVQSTSTQPLYVTGTNFVQGLTVSLTGPGGSTSTIGGSAILFSSSSNTFQMMAALPDAGAYSVRVVNPNGQTSAPWPFTVTAVSTRPTITGLSPRSPTESTAPQNVLVVGTNFVAGLSVSLTGPDGGVTTIGGSSIQSFTPTSFQFGVILATPGAYAVRVVNPDGQTSEPSSLSVKSTDARPMVAAISPSTPTAGPTSQTVNVSGAGFTTLLSVTITPPGGSPATLDPSAVSVSSPTSFQISVVLAVGGSYSLQVTNPSGPPSEPFSFTVNAPVSTAPSVNGISPKSPTAASGGQTIGIGGNNFVAGLTVQITLPSGDVETVSGNAIQSVQSVTSSQVIMVTATLPTAGSYSLRVINPDGQTSAPWAFTVHTPED